MKRLENLLLSVCLCTWIGGSKLCRGEKRKERRQGARPRGESEHLAQASSEAIGPARQTTVTLLGLIALSPYFSGSRLID